MKHKGAATWCHKQKLMFIQDKNIAIKEKKIIVKYKFLCLMLLIWKHKGRVPLLSSNDESSPNLTE